MKFFTILFIPFLLLTLWNDNIVKVTAESNIDEEEIDTDEGASVSVDEIPTNVLDKEEFTSPEKDVVSDTQFTVLFTKPAVAPAANLELPAGKPVQLLIGVTNTASIGYIIEQIDASFRYPMDYSFYIQNFTTVNYSKEVPSGWDATFFYTFVPSDSFASRPFGLSIGLSYKDEFGNEYYYKVYNETVMVVEIEEGLDGETFFLYVFLCAAVILLLVLGQQFLYSVGKKRMGSSTKKQNINLETGTKKVNSIDFDFIPKHTLNHINKGSKVTKPKSPFPKQRKTKRTGGSDK